MILIELQIKNFSVELRDYIVEVPEKEKTPYDKAYVVTLKFAEKYSGDWSREENTKIKYFSQIIKNMERGTFKEVK